MPEVIDRAKGQEITSGHQPTDISMLHLSVKVDAVSDVQSVRLRPQFWQQRAVANQSSASSQCRISCAAASPVCVSGVSPGIVGRLSQAPTRPSSISAIRPTSGVHFSVPSSCQRGHLGSVAASIPRFEGVAPDCHHPVALMRGDQREIGCSAMKHLCNPPYAQGQGNGPQTRTLPCQTYTTQQDNEKREQGAAAHACQQVPQRDETPKQRGDQQHDRCIDTTAQYGDALAPHRPDIAIARPPREKMS